MRIKTNSSAEDENTDTNTHTHTHTNTHTHTHTHTQQFLFRLGGKTSTIPQEGLTLRKVVCVCLFVCVCVFILNRPVCVDSPVLLVCLSGQSVNPIGYPAHFQFCLKIITICEYFLLILMKFK